MSLLENNDDNGNHSKIKFVRKTKLTTIDGKLFDVMKMNVDCSDLTQIAAHQLENFSRVHQNGCKMSFSKTMIMLFKRIFIQ